MSNQDLDANLPENIANPLVEGIFGPVDSADRITDDAQNDSPRMVQTLSEPIDSIPVVPDVLVPEKSTKDIEKPAGTHSRILAMTKNEELPVLKTYTSSRHQTCAVASAHLKTKEIKINFFPAIERSTLSGTTPIGYVPMKIILDDLIPTHEELFWRVGSERVNFNGIIYGTSKGIIRTLRKTGLIVKRDIKSIVTILKGLDWGRVALVPAPAYAPCFAKITDDNSLKSEKHLISAFREVPIGARDMTRVCVRCSEMLGRRVNGIRFVYRLAILYVYTRFATIEPGLQAVIRSVGTHPATLDASSWTTWQNEMLASIGCNNYVPWVNSRSEPNAADIRVYQLLVLAASDGVVIGGNTQQLPLFWPEIPNMTILGNFRNLDSFSEGIFTDASFVYGTGLAWCNRYGLANEFADAIHVVSMLYWANEDVNLVTGNNYFEFNLPEADMCGFILAPLLQVSDSLMPLKLGDYNEDMFLRMYESALGAMLISYSRSYQQYYLLDYALALGVFITSEDAEDAMSLIIKADMFSGAPIWAIAEACCESFGLKIFLGSVIHSIGYAGNSVDYKHFLLKLDFEHYVHSLDVIPFITRLPEDCEAARWIGAIPAIKKIDANQHYLFSDFADVGIFKTLRCVAEIATTTGAITLSNRTSLAVKSRKYRLFLVNKRGIPSDFLIVGFTMADGSQVQPGFIMKGTAAEQIANEPTHDRYNLTWFYNVSLSKNGVNVKPIEGLFTDPAVDSVLVNHGLRETAEKIRRIGDATDRKLNSLYSFDPNDRRPFHHSSGSSNSSSIHKPKTTTKVSAIVNQPAQTRPIRTWNQEDLIPLVGILAPDMIDKFYFMDQSTKDETVGEWIVNLAKVLKATFVAYRCSGATGGMLQVGTLNIDIDVLRKYKHNFVIYIDESRRSEFLCHAADLLGVSLCAFPNAESTLSTTRLIRAMRVMANHLVYNPKLTPDGFLKAQNILAPNQLAKDLCNQMTQPSEIINLILNQHDPTQVHYGSIPAKTTLSYPVMSILGFLDEISGTFDGVEGNIQNHMLKQFGDKFLNLVPKERDMVLSQCDILQEKLDSLRASRTTCDDQIQHFGSGLEAIAEETPVDRRISTRRSAFAARHDRNRDKTPIGVKGRLRSSRSGASNQTDSSDAPGEL